MQYIAALLIIPMNPGLIAFSAVVLLTGLLFFGQMAVLGKKRLKFLRATALQSS